MIKLQRLQADAAGQLQRRIEIGLGDADLSGRGMQLRLRLTDVRPAACKFRWQSNRHPWRHWRNRLASLQLRPQRVGSLTDQQAQCIDQLCFLLLQAGDCGQRGAQLGRGVCHVEVRGHPTSSALLGQIQALPSGANVVAGDLQLGLDAAELDVVASHFGEAGHQRRSLRLIRGLGARRRGFDRTPDPAPQVGLPRRIETALPDIERAQAAALHAADRVAGCAVGPGRRGDNDKHAMIAGLLPGVRRVGIEAGQFGRPGDPQLRPRFGEPDTGGLDIQVFGRDAPFQAGQHRVAK